MDIHKEKLSEVPGRFLEELVRFYHSYYHKDQDKIIKNIIKDERKQLQFKKIKYTTSLTIYFPLKTY